MDFVHDRGLAGYDTLVDKNTRRMNAFGANGAKPELVAEAIWKAATDGSDRLRYPVGTDAKGLLFMRRLLPDVACRGLMRIQLLR